MSGNFEFYAGGSSWVAFPVGFFDFLRSKNLKNSEICVAVFLWQYCYRNHLTGEFSLSLSKIAQEAFCSRRHVVTAIDSLKRSGALFCLKRGGAKAHEENLYRWNVEIFKTSAQFALAECKPCTTTSAQFAPQLVHNLHDIYLEGFLKERINSFKSAAASRHDVDNPQLPLGEDEVAPSGAFLSDEKVAAWMAAVAKLAPIFGHNHLYLFLKRFKPLDYGAIEHPEAFLRRLVGDYSEMYQLKKYFPNDFYETTAEWVEAMNHKARAQLMAGTENHLEGGEHVRA